MKTAEAAHILGLGNPITPDKTKQAYRQAAMKYHPDINPGGEHMMKIINAAYDALREFNGNIEGDSEKPIHDGDYSQDVMNALNAIIGLEGLEIEICGAWVWVGGDTRTHKDALKMAAFRYASKKKRWYFRPDGWRCSSRGSYSMDDIRATYGSGKPRPRRYSQIEQKGCAA